ncbi:hypothetical protein DXG01_005542, partial [Tephrocybe rancida]
MAQGKKMGTGKESKSDKPKSAPKKLSLSFGGRKKDEDPPLEKTDRPNGVSTRRSNAMVHPGAIVAPARKRTPAEMEAFRSQQVAEAKAKEDSRILAMQVAAALEDRMRQEEIDREKIANHPPDAMVPEFNEDQLAGNRKKRQRDYMSVESESDSDEYLDDVERPDASEEEEGEVVEEVDGEAIPPPKQQRKKKPKTGRADIQAAKQISTPSAPKKQKTNKPALSGLAPDWEKARSRNVSTTSVSSGVLTGADDSMVQYGGFASDGETDNVERPPAVKGTKSKLVSLINVRRSPPHVLSATKKEARGGAQKWTQAHLPDGTATLFKSSVVPLARIKAGTKAPWVGLTTDEIQAIVDE